jgi:hypothetical protein
VGGLDGAGTAAAAVTGVNNNNNIAFHPVQRAISVPSSYAKAAGAPYGGAEVRYALSEPSSRQPSPRKSRILQPANGIKTSSVQFKGDDNCIYNGIANGVSNDSSSSCVTACPWLSTSTLNCTAGSVDQRNSTAGSADQRSSSQPPGGCLAILEEGGGASNKVEHIFKLAAARIERRRLELEKHELDLSRRFLHAVVQQRSASIERRRRDKSPTQTCDNRPDSPRYQAFLEREKELLRRREARWRSVNPECTFHPTTKKWSGTNNPKYRPPSKLTLD